MAPLDNRPPKTHKTLFVAIIAIVLIVIVAAVAGYLYLDDQDRQTRHRDSLKQAFSDRLNATNDVYALVTGYPAAPDKNYVEDYRAWIDGYRQRVDNYTLAANLLASDGAAYRSIIASDDTDNANVTQACNRANDTVKSLNNSIKSHEAEYLTRLSLKNDASSNYGLALERSDTFYTGAWNLMQNYKNYLQFPGYLAYLSACNTNITWYNESLGLVKSTGETYRAFLKGSSYYAIDTTFNGMQDNVTKLQRKYAEQQQRKPNVSVNQMDINTAWSEDKGYYKAVNFQVINNAMMNNDDPNKISDVKVIYSLIDKATGAVRSTSETGVEMAGPYSRWICVALLPCDLDHEYDYKYTISFSY